MNTTSRSGPNPRISSASSRGLSLPGADVGSANLVCGFRPELWAAANPAKAPRHTVGFIQPIVGDDGYTMPATQHDMVMWAAAETTSIVFDAAWSLTAALPRVATLAEETFSWRHHDDLDLTGFVNGTRNPPPGLAAETILIPDMDPGAAGTVMLLQKWEHDAQAWARLPTAEQEKVIGRTKLDSIELDEPAQASHIVRTDQDRHGWVFRRDSAYGNVTSHGTTFVGFSVQTNVA